MVVTANIESNCRCSIPAENAYNFSRCLFSFVVMFSESALCSVLHCEFLFCFVRTIMNVVFFYRGVSAVE